MNLFFQSMHFKSGIGRLEYFSVHSFEIRTFLTWLKPKRITSGG